MQARLRPQLKRYFLIFQPITWVLGAMFFLAGCGLPDESGQTFVPTPAYPAPIVAANMPTMSPDLLESYPFPVAAQSTPSSNNSTSVPTTATPLPGTPCPTIVAVDPTRTTPLPIPVTMPMYDAALREFFQDSFTQSMFTTAHDSQMPVYIQPLVPGVVLDELTTTITARIVDYARSYDVSNTATDNPGQLVFSFSAPEVQPDSYTFTCKTGPTIFLSLAIRGQEEGTWQSRGYLMTETANGWQADLHFSGIS